MEEYKKEQQKEKALRNQRDYNSEDSSNKKEQQKEKALSWQLEKIMKLLDSAIIHGRVSFTPEKDSEGNIIRIMISNNSYSESFPTMTKEQADKIIQFFTEEEKRYVKELINQKPSVKNNYWENFDPTKW